MSTRIRWFSGLGRTGSIRYDGHFEAFVEPLLDVCADGLQHEKIELRDSIIGFHYRDEHAGRDEDHAVHPACEGFHSAEPACLYVDLGLVVRSELTVCKTALDLVLELLALCLLIEHLLRQPDDVLAVPGFCRDQRLRCEDQDVLAVEIRPVDLIDSDPGRE